MNESTIKTLELSELTLDAGTQARAAINEAAVKEYAEAMKDGQQFPPVHVFQDHDVYFLADGFHRVEAAKQTGATEIACHVHLGTRRDAVEFALGANTKHGIRRTAADKRLAAQIALSKFPGLSDRAIAELCKVSVPIVSDVRKNSGVNSDTCEPPQTETAAQIAPPGKRLGRDGKWYPAKRASSGPPMERPKDATGWQIPTELFKYWYRRDEAQELLSTISKLRSQLRAKQEEKDPFYVELNFASILANLDQAYANAKTVMPYAVCPICQGMTPDRCRQCKGRGLISEFLWNHTVPQETKDSRAKILAEKANGSEARHE